MVKLGSPAREAPGHEDKCPVGLLPGHLQDGAWRKGLAPFQLNEPMTNVCSLQRPMKLQELGVGRWIRVYGGGGGHEAVFVPQLTRSHYRKWIVFKGKKSLFWLLAQRSITVGPLIWSGFPRKLAGSPGTFRELCWCLILMEMGL